MSGLPEIETDPSAGEGPPRGLLGLGLQWVHWLVIAVSLAVTVFAWRSTREQHEEKVRTQFAREAAQVVELVVDRMKKYEDALWGGVGAIHAGGDHLRHPQWVRFARALQIDTKYPGINGIGVIHHVPPQGLADYLADQRRDRPDYRIHPPHDRPVRLPISYVEPVGPNLEAVGLDMAHEENRFTAVKKARDSGKAQITGPIVLVQDTGRTPGFLFFAPYYRGAPTSPEARRAGFLGIVYAPFVVRRLMEGVLAASHRHVALRLLDGEEVIYDEHVPDNPQFDPEPLYRKARTIELYGRSWTFDIRSARSFHALHTSRTSIAILVVGLLADCALLALFGLLARNNRRLAEQVAHRHRAEDRLRKANKELQRTTADLRHFVQAASHDLRSPMRGIASLAEFIQEDYADLLPEEGQGFLSKLRERVARLTRLLDSLLAHARIGREAPTVAAVEVGQLLAELVEDLELPDGFTVQIPPDLPTLEADRGGFALVFQNLVRNAVVHHDRGQGTVRVGWQDAGEWVEFCVEDDGPGVPAEYLDRVLEPFERLKTGDAEGSGMGLALVRRQVRAVGGQLYLESEGRGLHAKFIWPKKQSPTGA